MSKKNKKTFTDFFKESKKNKKTFTDFFKEGISDVLDIPRYRITDEEIIESIKTIKEIKFDVKKIKKTTIKSHNCYSDLLGDISNIEDLDERFEMLNEFCQLLQKICWKQGRIETLRDWRRFFNKKQRQREEENKILRYMTKKLFETGNEECTIEELEVFLKKDDKNV